MSDSDFFSFDKALDKLSLEEEDLKRLISAGEIRAFRDGSKMRLRVEDVDRVAGDLGLGGGEEEVGEVLEVEEVLFEEEADDTDQGMVTTQLSEEDTLLDDGVEEVELEEVAAAQPAVVPGVGAGARGGRGAGRARADSAEEQTVESGGMRLALIATTIVMAYGLAFLFAMHAAQSSGIT